MGQIFLVRHGQASFGSSNYDQLSTRGEEQAGLLGDWLAQRGEQVDRVVMGTMVRHQQTARGCLERLPTAPAAADWIPDSGFNEYNHDEVLHRHWPEFAQPGAIRRFLEETSDGNRAFQAVFQQAMARWMSGRCDQEYTEPWPLFQRRCVAALQRLIGMAGASQTTVVFTSGGTIATICQHLLRIPDPEVFALNWTLVNTGVTKLYYRRSGGLPQGRPHAQGHSAACESVASLTETGQQMAGGGASDPTPPLPILTLGYLNNYAHLERLGDRHAVTYR
ncbi:MAG: hypothetical protein NVSMB6_04100 [Burkholderiaceae bacterium]